MADFTINAQRVADRLNITLGDSTITAEKTETLIDDAIATIENELNVTIGELSGDAGSKTIDVKKKYAAVITDLAAIYVLCFISGGSATGFKFNAGSLQADVLDRTPQLSMLEKRLEKGLEELKAAEVALIVAQDES